MIIKTKNQINLVLANSWFSISKTPHFGLISLAAFIREKYPRINIIIVEGINLLENIIEKKPDVIGFSSDTISYTNTVKLAKKIKARIKVPIIIGGSHITSLPESLDAIFDLGVLGEGEITLFELLNDFIKSLCFKNDNLKKIKGIIFWEKGEIYFTKRRDLIDDLDSLPYPARDLVPMNEYYLKDQLNLFGVRRLGTIMTSRGCPYHCLFCGSPVQWGKARFYSPEHIVSEIKILIKDYRIDGVMFWDDLFIAPKKRFKELTRLIKMEGLDKKLVFFGYGRSNLIDEETCKLLKEINTKRLIFGMESGSEKILNYLKNNSVTIDDNKRSIILCRKHGITTSSGYIIGSPGETIEDLLKTYHFMKKYPLDNTHIYILTPYPGTEIWKFAEMENLVSKNMDFSKLFVQLPLTTILDFFRKNKPDIINNRIFLNKVNKNNRKYLDYIFKIQKLAYLQNLKFYIKMALFDPLLLLKFLTSKIKKF